MFSFRGSNRILFTIVFPSVGIKLTWSGTCELMKVTPKQSTRKFQEAPRYGHAMAAGDGQLWVFGGSALVEGSDGGSHHEVHGRYDSSGGAEGTPNPKL